MVRPFIRELIAKTLIAHSGADSTPEAWREFAEQRWGKVAALGLFTRAAVGGVTSSSPMSAVGAGEDEFFSAVFEASLLGRLQGLRSVPFNVRLLRMATRSRGYWVGQSKAIPLNKPTLAGSTLPRRKVGALIVMTKEALTAANPQAESRFEADMQDALVGAIDEAFLFESNAGVTDVMPPSVTNGVTAIPSSGEPRLDIAALIEAFQGNLSAAYFVSDPLTLARLGLARDPNGATAFPDVGPRGGSIVGIPALPSRGSLFTSSGGQVALIDPTGIAARMEAIEVARSEHALLEMDDAPAGASDTPVAGSLSRVSIFQTDNVALRATIHANWETQRPSVSVLTGVDYPIEVPAP